MKKLWWICIRKDESSDIFLEKEIIDYNDVDRTHCYIHCESISEGHNFFGIIPKGSDFTYFIPTSKILGYIEGTKDKFPPGFRS